MTEGKLGRKDYGFHGNGQLIMDLHFLKHMSKRHLVAPLEVRILHESSVPELPLEQVVSVLLQRILNEQRPHSSVSFILTSD
jgi:hypothetical protein